jgi:hypothetical protein
MRIWRSTLQDLLAEDEATGITVLRRLLGDEKSALGRPFRDGSKRVKLSRWENLRRFCQHILLAFT